MSASTIRLAVIIVYFSIVLVIGALAFRQTKSTAEGNLVLAASFAGWIPQLGLLPVAWGLAAAIVGAVVGSLLSPATAPSVVEAVLGPIDRALGGHASPAALSLTDRR